MNELFRVYLDGEKEIFEYENRKEEFGFSQSLLELLDLDITPYFGIFEKMGKRLQELMAQENVEESLYELYNELDSVADIHIYFKFIKHDWRKRLELYQQKEYTSRTDLLPIKKLTHIPSEIAELQRQIEDLLKHTLDVLSSDKHLQTKLADYYGDDYNTSRLFCFLPLTTKYERLDYHTFVETLYPETIYDIINFFIRAFMARQQPFRLCKSCGRYFAVTHGGAEYCNRIFRDTGRTCKEVGSVKAYQQKAEENPAIKLYNRAYKTHFARIKYKKMTKEEFQAWAAIARAFRDQVLEGNAMSLDEYKEWLDQF